MSQSPSSSPVADDRAQWFADQVQPHDTSLKSYLRRSFPTIFDVNDVVQESYARVWTYQAKKTVRNPKTFLFKVAHGIALDKLRRERRIRVTRLEDSVNVNVPGDEPVAYEKLEDDEKVQLLIDAIDALPRRCREVLRLRKFKFMSQREVAILLGVSEKCVENQLAIGVHRCREFLRRRGMKHFYGDEF